MEETLLLGQLESGDGLKLDIAIRIADAEGESREVATDLMDLFSNYINQYQDDDLVAHLRVNLGLDPGGYRG